MSIDDHAPLNIQYSVLMSIDEHAPLNIQCSVPSIDEHVPLNIQCSVPNVIGGFARALSLISIQKWPFSNSALQHLQLLSFGANFCYHSCRIFLMRKRKIFCSSAITTAECFSPDKYSALLLPQLQNVSHQGNVLLFCYDNCRVFLIREIFCSSVATTAECFSPAAKFCSCAPTEIFCCSGITVAEF